MNRNALGFSFFLFSMFEVLNPNTPIASNAVANPLPNHDSPKAHSMLPLVQISESVEHVQEGDLSLGPHPGYLILENHLVDLPEYKNPISTWPHSWQALYQKGTTDQKRLLQKGLSYGEIMALSGDLYETYVDLSTAPLQEIYELLPLIHSPLVTTQELQKVTGGRYLDLATKNKRHFTNVPKHENNVATWKSLHLQAIAAARAGDATKAWGLNAASSHFLTDAFCSGHVRVPREAFMGNQLGNLYSKILHDLDNETGVLVNNARGDGPWTAYGDAFLHDPRNRRNLSLMLEAVLLSKQDIEAALKQGQNFPIPTENLQFFAERLVPFPVVPQTLPSQQTQRYAYSSLGFTKKGWSPIGMAVLIGNFMAKEQASAYGRALIKIAVKELPSYLDGLIHEDDYARAWVNRYSLPIIRRQPAQEKARLLMILLDDWISQEDQLAIQKIVTSISSALECERILQLVFSGMNPLSLKLKQKYIHSTFEKYVNGCRFFKADHE